MGGHNTKEKKEEPIELNTNARKIINEQKIYIKDDCTSGNTCVKFTNNNKYYKKYKNKLLKKYGIVILVIIYFLLLSMLFSYILYKK